ncbi:MAG: rhodanese-like domain-containing protein [Pseudomonadota bacterium]
MSSRYFKLCFLFVLVGGCQTPPTEIVENDISVEGRLFSKSPKASQTPIKRLVIVDVRSQFDFEMSRLPRSFFAFWKDWDLRGLSGGPLENKRKELQRLLALKGIDPVTRVAILGKGLKGQGEEFLLATTLKNLGIEKIQFMTPEMVKKAFAAKNLPKLENAPGWSRPENQVFYCSGKNKRADIVIGGNNPGFAASDIFDSKLKMKKTQYPKRRGLQVTSQSGHWANGLVLYLREIGREACVL